ncbi:MAG: hypothetical protein ACRC2R_05535 [Xenococcaceae cyanobacterium]
MVGVNRELISFGVRPISVAWFGLLPEVRITSPPASRTLPTVVTPICPCGMVAANSFIDNPIPHSTEIPVTPLGCVPIPR